VVRTLLARVRPTLEEFGDWELVSAVVEESLKRGDIAHRLRRIVAGGGLTAAVDYLVTRTRARGVIGAPVSAPGRR
jgi:carboxylate-amine ligase